MSPLLVRLGALSLLLSALLRWFVHPSPAISEDTLDGLVGLFHGLTIGFFLLAIYRRSHPKPRATP